jgi:hypothetical protein
LVEPTHTIDVNGNARIRNVIDDVTPNYLLLGNPVTGGAGAVDVEVQKLAFSGNPNETLLGDGTWGTLPSTGIGNYCTATPNPLTGDYQIPMNDFNYHFSDNGSAAAFNNVGIGTECIDPLLGKLQVQNNIMQYGVLVSTATNTVPFNYGIYANAQDALIDAHGIYGQALSAVCFLNKHMTTMNSIIDNFLTGKDGEF